MSRTQKPLVSLDRELGGEYFKPGLVTVRSSVGEIIGSICICFLTPFWLMVKEMGKCIKLSVSRTQYPSVSFDRELGGEYFKPGLVFVRPSVAEIIESIYIGFPTPLCLMNMEMGKMLSVSLTQ